MRVVLVVLNGPHKGKQKLLRIGQKLRIGRTERADWSFENDERMSGRHFEVWTDDVGCYVKDLGSRNGTLINGEVVVEHLLMHEDEITAGDTKFQVTIEGGNTTEAESRVSMRGSFTDEPAIALAMRGELKIGCTMEKCEGDWKLFRGKIEELKPGALCHLLSSWAGSLWLIIDFGRLGIPRPDNFPGDYLFKWLPKEVQEAMSPWAVLCGGMLEVKDWKPMVNDGWGQDGILALLTDLEPPEMLEHLQSVCRVKSGATEGVSGLCWPSILSTSLLSSQGDLVAKFMKGVKGAIVEFPDYPDTWQVFAPESLAEALKKFGMRMGPTAETKA